MKNTEESFYIKLRVKIQDWIKTDKGKNHKYVNYILVVPDLFYILWQLLIDDRVSTEFKLKVGLVIAYFVSPIDLIPEAIFGPVGYLDDIGLTAGLLSIMMEDYREIVEEIWAKVNHNNILELVQEIIKNIDNIIGHGIWNRLRTKFGI